MQRCGSSNSNKIGPFHAQPNSLTMLFSVPFDHEPSLSSVDCTLSLGTPSTRAQNRSCVKNLCWDLLHSPFQPPTFPKSSCQNGRVSRNDVNGDILDPMLARRCANCDTTSTPLWRNGPRGPKSLCNACGIRFKKEERRAAAASTNDTTATVPTEIWHHGTWVPPPQSPKVPCLSSAISEDSSAIPFLSWRLNMAERPSVSFMTLLDK